MLQIYESYSGDFWSYDNDYFIRWREWLDNRYDLIELFSYSLN